MTFCCVWPVSRSERHFIAVDYNAVRHARIARFTFHWLLLKKQDSHQARSQGGSGGARPLAKLLCPPPPLTLSKFLPVLVFYFDMWAVLCLPSSSMQMMFMLSQILSPLYAHWATAAERDTETSDNLQCLYCLKTILVKLIKICKFLSDSNKEAKCAWLWIFQYSSNYLLTWVMSP